MDPGGSAGRLRAAYPDSTLLGLPQAEAAAGLILAYLEQTQSLSEASSLEAPHKRAAGETMQLDAATQRHLEIVETEHLYETIPATAAEVFTLKAVTAWPKTATDDKATFIFTDLVEQLVAKKAPGELKINYIGGPEAVKTMDQVAAAQRGMVDIVFTTNAYYLSVLPEVDAMKLSTMTPMEERASGAWAYFNTLHEQRLGLRYQGKARARPQIPSLPAQADQKAPT